MDLRTEVTGFIRTRDRYLAVLETVVVLNDFLAPPIETSTYWSEWSVRQVDVDEPFPIDGLRRDYNMAGAAVSGEQVLVGLQANEELARRRDLDVGLVQHRRCLVRFDCGRRR